MGLLFSYFLKYLAKDGLTDSLENFEDFDNFRRSERQSIHEYVAIFDAKYRKIEKKKMTQPPRNLSI